MKKTPKDQPKFCCPACKSSSLWLVAKQVEICISVVIDGDSFAISDSPEVVDSILAAASSGIQHLECGGCGFCPTIAGEPISTPQELKVWLENDSRSLLSSFSETFFRRSPC